MPKKDFSKIIHHRPTAGRQSPVGSQQADWWPISLLLADWAVGHQIKPSRPAVGRQGPVGLQYTDRPAVGRLCSVDLLWADWCMPIFNNT